MENFDVDKVLENIWLIVREDNKYIEDTKPWELAKKDEVKFNKVMEKLINDLNLISEMLIPFMPETSEKIKKALKTKERVILFERIK
jgi:methionyl-tRNA synthetase